MSGGRQDENGKPDIEGTEGWESVAEESGKSLAVNPELEAALREASEAIDEDGHVKRPEPPDRSAADQFSEEEVERMAGQLVENRDKYVRLLADFDNFRRRAHKERQDVILYGHENLVKDLLSTVDNLERAIEHSEQNANADLRGLLQGVDLVRRELLAALGKHGVSVIEAQDQVFDPTLHEAMGQIPDDSVPPGTVIQVLQKGYQLHDRMLRPARVMVAAAKREQDADDRFRGE